MCRKFFRDPFSMQWYGGEGGRTQEPRCHGAWAQICAKTLVIIAISVVCQLQVFAQEDDPAAVEPDSREAARQRELSAEEDPTARRRAEREAEREESGEETKAEGKGEEKEGLQEQAQERELSGEEDPMTERARRFEEGREAVEQTEELVEDADAPEREEARQREQAADEDPATARRAARDAERESASEQGAEEDLVEAELRELGAEKDPMSQEQADRAAQREADETAALGEPGPKDAPGEDKKYAEKVQYTPSEGTTGFDIYGSLRVRYRDQAGESGLQDGSSRVGADWEWQFKQGSYVFGRYEAGFNILAEVNDLVNPGENSGEESENSFFSRLAYIGVDTPIVAGVIGKNWSTYYKVTAFTDRFMGTGGSASGTYNAQTDGGPTGTGRADSTVQSQMRIEFLPQKWFKPFDLNIQVQDGNTIPFTENVDYGTAVGVSAVMTTQKDFTVGLAINYADVDIDANPELRRLGISGSAVAATLGTRAFGDRWYAGLLVSRLENHETTDDGIYFDGWGSELYGQYRLRDRLWLIGGYNILAPDSDQRLAREYQVKYAVVGLRFTFDDFRRMIYANIRYDDSRNADGTSGSNVYTVGIRWDLSRLGWHASTVSDAPPPEAN
jgi:hypothetical protein